MTHTIRHGARLAFAAAALAFLHAPVHAQSADDIANRLIAIAKAQGATLAEFSSASETGAGVLIEGFHVESDKPEHVETRVDSVLFSNPELTEDGIKADTITIKGFSADSGNSQFAIGDGVLEGVTIPGAMDAAMDGKSPVPAVYSKMHFSNITVTTDDQVEIPIASFTIENSDFVDTQPRKITLAVEGISLTAENATDEDAKAQMKALGYESILGHLRGDFRWDDSANEIHVNAMELGAADVGTLRIAAQVGGITKEFLAGRQGKEAMELMQSVTIKSLSINFNNDSVIERVIKMQAEEAGTEPGAFVDGLLAQLPAMLMILQNEPFAKKAEAAVTAFMREPRNLTISASPAQPLPATQIMGAAMIAPQSLIGLLNVDVAANK